MTDSIIPFFEDASPDTELQRRVRQSQRLRVWRSLSDSYGKDPSKPTEAFNANLGPFVDDYIAQQERMRQDLVRATKRTESSPATSEWIANPDYARMSWDDVDSLAATESGISKAFVGAGRIVGKTLGVAEDIGASFVGGTVDLAGNLLSVAGALPEQAIELFRTAGYSPPAFRKMFLEDLARQGMTSREIARIEQQITPQTQEEFIQEGGFFPTVSGIARGVKEAGFALTTLSQQAVTPLRTPLKDLLGVDGIDPQSTYGAALSGIRSLPPMLAVAPLYPVLGVHGAGAAFVVPVYGQALLQAEQKGLSGQAAHTYALGSAGVEYLTNIVPGGKFLAGMKLKSPLLQRIKDQLPAELVQENIATATQDLLDMAVLEPEKTLEEYLRERPERAWHTIVATTVGVSALNTTVRVAERMAGRLDQQQAATQVGDNVLQAVIEGLRNSKVQQRSPKLAGMFANMSLEKQGADVARIDSEVLQQILTESGIGDEFLQEFPGIAEQLNQNGTDPGTEVELSSGEFAAQMALSERYADIAERMRPNLRLGASEFSLAEESQIEAERQRIRQDMDSLAQQQVQDAEENANQRQAILKELTDFAVQMPGINKKKAAAQAEVAVSMWSNLAKANNMKVGELWDLMKPVLAAGDITIPEMTGGGILSQPSVGEDYEGPEPKIPQEMLSEGEGQKPGSVKFTKWDDLIRFVDAKTESDVLGALASVTGQDVGPAATEAEVAESASEAMASAITGELTGQQWRDLSSKLLLAGDAESSLVGYVNDIASSLIAGGDSSVFRDDGVQLSESQMRANAMQASMLFVEFAKRHENLSRFVEGLSEAEIEGAGVELRDWNSPVYRAFERVADEMSVAQAYELLGDLDAFAKRSYGDEADALRGFKDRLATAFGYEYLGNDEMISERAAYEQSVRDPDVLYAPQLPRITPEQDAAYMQAVESGDTQAQQAAVDQAATEAGYSTRLFRHVTSNDFDVFDISAPNVNASKGGNPAGAYFSSRENVGETYPGRRTISAYLKYSNPYNMAGGNTISQAGLDKYREVLNREFGLSSEWVDSKVRDFQSRGRMPFTGMSRAGQTEVLQAAGFDSLIDGDDVAVFSPEQVKSADPVTRDADGNVIPLSQRFDVTQPSILYAPEADAGRRGAYEPRPMRIILTQKADATTLIHEFTHHYLHSLSILAHNKDAPEAIITQFQTLLDWFGVADVAAWDALPADQKAVHHEAFTYNFEQFIGTGKAPTKRLRDVFKRVAAWMRKIYGDIRGELNAAYRKEFGRDLPALTPEVREVFEAMLGAESGTAEAAAELGFSPVFQSQEESGMNDEEWEAYNLGAELVIDEATSTLTASTARAMRWLDGAMARVIRAKTKQAKKERKAIRDRIKAEVEQQPVYRVMNMLRRGVVIEEDGTERKVEGQHRLNAESVKQMFPADTKDPGYLDLSSLRAGRYGMIAKDGIDPAVVADQFGYDSAAQMIRDLVAVRPINDVINERTNKEIEKRHPELSPAAIKQAAMESLHNEAMSKFVATELRFLAGIQKPTRIVVEAARREAEAKIATLGYKSLTPSKFLAAERRAARTADQWMRSGDRRATIEQQRSLTEARKALREAQATGDEAVIADAQLNVQQAQLVLQQAREELAQEPGRATVDAIIRAKWNQLYQGMLYREAVAARKRFEKHQRYLRRIAKDSKRKRILPEYADQIDYILRRLNISGVSRATSEQMSADRVKFLSWLEEQTNQNIEYSMSEGDLNLLAQRPIEDIPMESLDAIVDTIESIYHRGFVIRNGVVMQQKKRIKEAEGDAVSEINEHAGKERPKNTTPATVLGRVQKSLYTFFNQHIKTAARARVIGGGKHGVFWNLFIRPANRQAAEEQQVIADLSQRLEGILQPFYERGAGTIDSGKTMARRKFNKSTGKWESDPTRPPRSLTREEVFVLALNLGNESNIQRVVDGFGITIEEAREITSSLSAGELRAVQQIWDLFAELKPKISAMERRLYGKEPKWLTPAPIALQSNDGTTVELSGGYFPIKYDRSASELGIKIEAANEARTQLQGAFMGTQTRDSYKKTRADRVFGKPLLLQTSTLFNGLTEIVHDLSWREYIVDFNLLMPSDGAIPQAIIDRYGAEWMQDIRQWVKDIAAAGPGPAHPSEAWMQALRRSISISRLGFSPITGLLQQTGTVIAVEHVGAKHVADAVAKFMGDMRGSYTEMLDKSPAMRNRFRTQFRELGEQAARIRGKTTTVMQFERAAYSMILHSQMIPDTITWHAAYSRAFEDNPNISEQEAADRAYQAVLDTQGSGDITNLSTIERGGPASKLLTVFYTWQNTLFNELYVIAKTEGLSEKGAFQLAMLAIALPFLTVAIRDIAPDDEEERRKRLTGKGSMSVAEQYLWATLKESINTLGGSMVGVREVIPTIASVLSGERAFEYRGPAGFAPMTDFIGAVRAGAESGIMSKRFAKQSMYFLGDIGRLPSTQINRMIDGIDAMIEGKDVPWWAVVLGTQK